jgi:hypothetical protein
VALARAYRYVQAKACGRHAWNPVYNVGSALFEDTSGDRPYVYDHRCKAALTRLVNQLGGLLDSERKLTAAVGRPDLPTVRRLTALWRHSSTRFTSAENTAFSRCAPS